MLINLLKYCKNINTNIYNDKNSENKMRQPSMHVKPIAARNLSSQRTVTRDGSRHSACWPGTFSSKQQGGSVPVLKVKEQQHLGGGSALTGSSSLAVWRPKCPPAPAEANIIKSIKLIKPKSQIEFNQYEKIRSYNKNTEKILHTL